DNDDPRLTAYALGELEPPDSVEVESLIATDVDARKLVDEIRQTARWLSDGLKKEHDSPASLSLDNHRLIEQTLEKTAPPITNRPWWRRPSALSSVAAVLVGGVTIGWLSLSAMNPVPPMSAPAP